MTEQEFVLINNNDGNIEVPVGRFGDREEVAAYICAVQALGYTLVSRPIESEDNDG